MKKIIRFALMSVFALFSTAAMADTTTVGNEDNTTGWWTAFSDYYTIAPNKTLTLKFKNYSSKAQNWNNWLAVVTTDADRGAEGYSEYVVLRADNYAWQGALNTGAESSHDWYTSLASNYNWDIFPAEMDGSDVVMTITRLNEKVTVRADITATSGNTYFEEFVINCGDGTQTIRTFLTTEGGHLVIDNDATQITDTDIPTPPVEGLIGNEDNTTAWWTAFSDYFTLQKNQILTLQFENYSSKANNWNNWLAVVTTDADRGAEGYSEYVALRVDNYAWQGALNTGAESSHDWYISLSSNYNWDTFKDDMDGSTVVMTVKRDYQTVTIHADITATSGNTYFEEFVIDCGDGEQAIRTFLTTDGGHLIMKSSAITDNPTPTGIEAVETANTENCVRYNLAGQKVGNDFKGVIIENGKKFVVR